MKHAWKAYALQHISVFTFSHLKLHYYRQKHWCKLNRFCMLNSAAFWVGTPSIQCNNGIILGFQCKLNLNICTESDYNTNLWSINIKLNNLRASCKKLNHPSTRLGALLPFTWVIDTKTPSSTNKPTVSTLHIKFTQIMRY
jgi:hypothetical protein